MNRILLGLVLLAMLAGCGGKGGSSPLVLSPWAGNYAGTYVSTTVGGVADGQPGPSGDATLLVRDSGGFRLDFGTDRVDGRVMSNGSFVGDQSFRDDSGRLQRRRVSGTFSRNAPVTEVRHAFRLTANPPTGRDYVFTLLGIANSF